jgi:hypothetical protein
LPKLKRSLRFVWVPEWNGMMPYIDAHPELVGPELGGKFLGNVNLDMVGENQELLHSMMIITRTPNSIPSVLNDVVENMAQMVDGLEIRTARGSQSQFNYRVTPYSGGSDHMMFIDRKIPGNMIVHGPDYTHHTSDDTPDKVDPVELQRSEMIASGTVYYLSNLADDQAADLLNLSSANGAKRMGDAARSAAQIVQNAEGNQLPDALHEALVTINETGRVVSQTLSTVSWYNTGKGSQKAHQEFQNRLAEDLKLLSDRVRRLAAARNGGKSVVIPAGSADKRIPVRLTRGPLDFGLPESKLSPEDAAASSGSYQVNGDLRFEAVNFIDGKRTVADIETALVGEFGRRSFKGLSRFMEDLVKVGVVRWK